MNRNLGSPSAPGGEDVEKEIDGFISCRQDQRVRDEGEREEEAAWVVEARRQPDAGGYPDRLTGE